MLYHDMETISLNVIQSTDLRLVVPHDCHVCPIRILIPRSVIPKLHWGASGHYYKLVGTQGKQRHLSDIDRGSNHCRTFEWATASKLFGPNYLINAVIRYFLAWECCKKITKTPGAYELRKFENLWCSALLIFCFKVWAVLVILCMLIVTRFSDSHFFFELDCF